MTYSDIIGNVANELNLPSDLVKATYESYWKYIKSTIEKLPIKEDISEEDFIKLRCNFNLPSLGKLCCTLDRFKKMKQRMEYIKNLKNNVKNKEN